MKERGSDNVGMRRESQRRICQNMSTFLDTVQSLRSFLEIRLDGMKRCKYIKPVYIRKGSFINFILVTLNKRENIIFFL